jgi:hypothetical protein
LPGLHAAAQQRTGALLDVPVGGAAKVAGREPGEFLKALQLWRARRVGAALEVSDGESEERAGVRGMA